jgi:DNA repair ATPase RecN
MRRKQGKHAAQPSALTADDSAVATVARASQGRLSEAFGGRIQFREGDAFDLAREDNPGKWTRQFLQERKAKRKRFLERLVKELQSGDMSEPERRKRAERAIKQIGCFRAQQRSVRILRALMSAQARDRIDSFVERLKAEAHSLKKSDKDFQDIDRLADTLIPIIEALEEHEKIAKPMFFDAHPLSELATLLVLTDYLNRLMGVTQNRAKMIHIRAKRSSKSQDRNKGLIERAVACLKQNPKQGSKR